MVKNTGTKLLAFGEIKTLQEWSEDGRCIVNFKTLSSRFRSRNWDLEKSLITPLAYKKAADFVGKIFNFLLIKKITKTSNGNTVVLCECLYKNCGNEIEIPFRNAQNKHSCGCMAKESHLKRITKHGQNKNPMLHIWYNFNSRCYNENSANFLYYGERGIFVCDEWKWHQPDELGLLNFVKWCKNNPRPNNKYSLDRINNDGTYSPENCKWSTHSEQCKNKRNIKYFERKLKEKESIIEQLKIQIENLEKETHV